jgi:hypothetical protein
MVRGFIFVIGLLIQIGLAHAQPQSASELEKSIETLRRQVDAMPRVDAYSRAEIDRKIDAVVKTLKAIEARANAPSDVDKKVAAVADARIKAELDPIREKLKPADGDLPWPLLLSAAGLALSLAALWRAQTTRSEVRAKAEADQRASHTRQFVDEWLDWSKSDRAGQVHDVLKQPSKLADAENMTKVVSVGTWMNRVASDWIGGNLDKNIVERHDIKPTLQEFWRLLEAAKDDSSATAEVKLEIEQRQREWSRLEALTAR